MSIFFFELCFSGFLGFCCSKATLTLLDNDLFVGLPGWEGELRGRQLAGWMVGYPEPGVRDAYLSGMSKRQNIIYAAHATVRPINEVYVQLFMGLSVSTSQCYRFLVPRKISPKSGPETRATSLSMHSLINFVFLFSLSR